MISKTTGKLEGLMISGRNIDSGNVGICLGRRNKRAPRVKPWGQTEVVKSSSSQAALEPTHHPHPCPLRHKPYIPPKTSSLPSAVATCLSLRHLSYEEKLRQLWLFSLEKAMGRPL